MGNGRELKVTILGDDSALQRTFKATEASTEKMATVMETASVQVEHLKESLLGLFGITAVAFGLEKVVTDAVDFTLNVQKMTAALNGNAEAGSTWLAVADKVGLDTTMLSRAFANVSKEAETNKGVLVNMGIATQDAAGNMRPMNDMLMEAVDWFHQNAGSSNEATYAQQLFGKSSGQILALLEQGRGAFATIKEEAAAYGLILNNDVLQRQLAMVYQMKEGQAAVHALSIDLGEALMPALAAVGQGLANFVHNHLQQFIDAVNTAVSWVIGIGEAFGLWDASASEAAQSLAGTAQATDNFGTSAGGATNNAKALAEATKAIRDAARDATQAIDEQTRGIDKQIKALQDAQKSAAFDAKQTAIKQQEADKQKQIDDLKITKAYQVWSGNLAAAQTTQEKIDTLNSEVAKLEVQYNQNASAEVIADKIDSLNQQKSVLADQKRSIQDAAQAQIDAMQQAGSATVEAQRTASLAIPPLFDKSGKDAADKFKFALNSSAEANGKEFATKIRTAISTGDWKGTGEAIGEEVGKGIAAGMNKGIKDWIGSNIADPVNNLIINAILGQGISTQNPGGFGRWGNPSNPAPTPPSTLGDTYADGSPTHNPFDGSLNPPPGAPGHYAPAPPPNPNSGHGPGGGTPPPGAAGQAAQTNALLAQITEHLAAIRYASGDSVYGQVAVIHTGG